MRALALLLPTASLLAIGCDADCGNPARLDGRYQVESNTINDDWSVTGFDESESDAEVAHLHGVFANGPATWNLKHVPADGGFRVTIDGQQYTATYTPSASWAAPSPTKMSGALMGERARWRSRRARCAPRSVVAPARLPTPDAEPAARRADRLVRGACTTS